MIMNYGITVFLIIFLFSYTQVGRVSRRPSKRLPVGWLEMQRGLGLQSSQTKVIFHFTIHTESDTCYAKALHRCDVASLHLIIVHD